jgi:hypothetical protein
MSQQQPLDHQSERTHEIMTTIVPIVVCAVLLIAFGVLLYVESAASRVH